MPLSSETQKILREEREKLFINAELYIELEEYKKAIETIDRIVKISHDLGDIDESSPKLKKLLDLKRKILSTGN